MKERLNLGGKKGEQVADKRREKGIVREIHLRQQILKVRKEWDRKKGPVRIHQKGHTHSGGFLDSSGKERNGGDVAQEEGDWKEAVRKTQEKSILSSIGISACGRSKESGTC